jgi:hypothetical protein
MEGVEPKIRRGSGRALRQENSEGRRETAQRRAVSRSRIRCRYRENPASFRA